ncbi:hypothetical protein P4132_22185 [Pseudomonas aeruginosa]|nr:hypothetical protein [Pseudomonas aeruginosa]
MAFLLIGLSEHRPQPLGQGSPLRWLALLFGLLAWHAGAGERVIYPRHSEGRNPEPYVVELLQLALARSGGDYRLEPSAQPMPQSRAQLRLEQDDPGLQVMWAQSRDDLEETLLPIRIPIYRGLIGWRIPWSAPPTRTSWPRCGPSTISAACASASARTGPTHRSCAPTAWR